MRTEGTFRSLLFRINGLILKECGNEMIWVRIRKLLVWFLWFKMVFLIDVCFNLDSNVLYRQGKYLKLGSHSFNRSTPLHATALNQTQISLPSKTHINETTRAP